MREIAATMTHVFPAMFLISGNIGSEDQEDPVEGTSDYLKIVSVLLGS